jgi:glycosyltransferase involved in cell wall biosynthesis
VLQVILIGRFDKFSGYKTICECYIKAFKIANIKYICIDVDKKEIAGSARGINFNYDPFFKCYEFNDPSIVIFVDQPTKIMNFKISGSIKVISSTIFETESFPATWLKYFDLFFDEIWIPTAYNFKTFQYGGINKKKISIIPYCYDTFYYNYSSQIAYIKNKLISFLYICSNYNRKDPILLIESFIECASKRNDLSLTIKVPKKYKETIINYFKYSEEDLYKNFRIRLICEELTKVKIRNLYEKTDFYISTERAKGWDFPALDAISMGIKVISVNSSAISFLNDKNSELIRSEEIEFVPNDLVTNNDIYQLNYWPHVNKFIVSEAILKAVNFYISEKNLSKYKDNVKKTISFLSADNLSKKISKKISNYKTKNKSDKKKILRIFI